MKLNQLAQIQLGANVSRVELDQDQIYTYDDLIYDLEHFMNVDIPEIDERSISEDDYVIYCGDVVYSFISERATIVSQINTNKVINQNFLKLIVSNQQIDKMYLCFYLNVADGMKRQLQLLTQGTLVRRIPISKFRNLEIPLPDLKRQRQLGLAYFKSVRIDALAHRREKLETKLLNGILNEMGKIK